MYASPQLVHLHYSIFIHYEEERTRVLGCYCFVASGHGAVLEEGGVEKARSWVEIMELVGLNWVSETGGEKMGKVPICVLGAITEKHGFLGVYRQ